MKRRWNNGDLTRGRREARRLEARKRVTLPVAIDRAREALEVAMAPGWLEAWSPVLRGGGAGASRRGAFWEDRRFGEWLLGRRVGAVHGVLIGHGATRWQALVLVRCDVAVALEVRLHPGGPTDCEAEIVVTLSALRPQGNSLIDGEVDARLASLTDAIARRLAQGPPEALAPPQTLPEPSTRRAGHQVVLGRADSRLGPEEAFRLACPVAELQWIEHWFFDLVHSDSGVNEPHCVFVEAMSSPMLFGRSGRTHWYTVTYDRAARSFQAVLINGNATLGLFDFRYEPLPEERMLLRWDLTVSARSAEGERLLAEPGVEGRIADMLRFLSDAITHYLATERCYHMPLPRKTHLVLSRLRLRLRRRVQGLFAETSPA